LLKEEKTLFSKKLFVISHNDFQASNIIVMPDKKIGFIDFTQSNLFFPANDVAYFLTHAEIMFNRILSAEQINKIKRVFIQTYCKSTKKQIARFVKKYISLFEIRAAFDIMAITVTLLGKKDKNRQRYIKILINKIENDIKLWKK
jgi:thiamine kinase-like enzyme